MERMVFITDKGRVVFGLDSPYRLQKAEGVSDGELFKTTAQYPDTDGRETLGVLYEPRAITVKGYIRANSKTEMYALRKKMISVLNGKDKGTLEYYCATGNYKTEAELETLVQWGTPMQTFYPFIIYFVATKFFWKSLYESIHTVLRSEKLIKTTFTLPCAFSSRSAISYIWNKGEVDAPCIIEIFASQGAASLLSADSGIEVINHTTGKHILIDYDMQPGETLTVDTENITVTSSIGGNLLNKVQFEHDEDFETALNLSLCPGKNEIECINYNSACPVAVVVRHYDLFVGV